MPGGDRTGPLGYGPRTGRGAGYCAGYDAPGYANPWSAGGFRWPGRGGGRGHRNMYYATGLPFWARGGAVNYPPMVAQQDPESELNALKQQAEYFQNMLNGIQDRMSEIEAKLEKK